MIIMTIDPRSCPFAVPTLDHWKNDWILGCAFQAIRIVTWHQVTEIFRFD